MCPSAGSQLLCFSQCPAHLAPVPLTQLDNKNAQMKEEHSQCSPPLSCRYAKLERGLGEIDRARAIYIHASAMADPRRDPAFWADWNSFEVSLSLHASYFQRCSAVVMLAELLLHQSWHWQPHELRVSLPFTHSAWCHGNSQEEPRSLSSLEKL